MIKKTSFIVLATFATLGGLYPLVYFAIDRRFGLLGFKSEALLADTLWNIAFYIHILLGGVALLIGWTQFVTRWRTRYVTLHRGIGKIYVGSVLVSAVTSIYIALFATGGFIPSAGFIAMGSVWFFTTFKAYTDIKERQILSHQRMMIYSYATCLAAVTLRMYLPVFIAVLGDFNKAYAVVSWLSWVPNIVVAFFIIRKFYPERLTATASRLDVTPAKEMPQL